MQRSGFDTPDPEHQWESDKLTVRHHKREPRVRHFPIGILGQVLYLIVSIPDLFTLTYFVVSYKRKYVREVMVNCLVKLAWEKVVRQTDCLATTISVDLNVKQQNKQLNTCS